MINKPFYIGFLILIGLSSCQTSSILDENETRFYVNSQKVDCTGVVPMKCMQVKENKNDTWTLFYSDIKGFDYEAGYEYELIVKKEDKKKPIPADASSIEYTLVKEVKKVKK